MGDMKYFDAYMKRVDSGMIELCYPMQLARKRIDRFREEYQFKQEEADKRIGFIENECSNTKGLRSKLKLALPQRAILETAWGFYHDANVTKTNPDTLEEYHATEERRLIHEVPIIVPRGSGKTTLGSAIGAVGQIMDGEWGADIQMLAYNREQAGYLFNASRAMTSYEDSLLYLLKRADILSSTKQGMLYRETNSLMSIKTSDYESLDGTNAHYNIFDEVHTYDEDFLKVVNDGSSRKRKNWMTWYISTNGTKRDRVFDVYYKTWMEILEGKRTNDSVMPFIYKLDSAEEIHDPSKWHKAMFMLGITTEKETIAQDIEMAQGDPAKQAEIMAKTFNLPTNNYLAFFTNEECKGNSSQFDLDYFKGNDDRKAKCVLGLDLSDVNDICSCSFMSVDGDKRYFKNLKFLPRIRVNDLPKAQVEQYERWEKEGQLILHEYDTNDQKFIFDTVKEFMDEHGIYPVAVGYDKWGAKEIVRYFNSYYGDICIEIPQTVKELSTPLKIYKAKIKAGKIIFDDSVATWCHANVNVKIDGNQNIFPNRAKAKNKIDVFASQLDAFICFEKEKENLEYYFN